jgi:polyphenol oxidase
MVRFTGRAEGHLGWTASSSACRAVVDLPWAKIHQVHGNRIVDESGAGDDADGIVTSKQGVALAVSTADCAAVTMASTNGVIAAVHAGWAGLLNGVLTSAADAMRDRGATTIEAALGPCIHAECYEFSEDDLSKVVAVLGDEVRGTTSQGRPALDIPAAVRASLDKAGVQLVADVDRCTSCAPGYFSHRARKDPERQVGVIWIP